MATTGELQEKLDRLQGELSSRRSTTFFARGAIALLIGLLIGSASTKLYLDSSSAYGWTAAKAFWGVAALLAVAAAVEFFRGRHALRGELVRLEELKALRRELRVDDPPSLLPSR